MEYSIERKQRLPHKRDGYSPEPGTEPQLKSVSQEGQDLQTGSSHRAELPSSLLFQLLYEQLFQYLIFFLISNFQAFLLADSINSFFSLPRASFLVLLPPHRHLHMWSTLLCLGRLKKANLALLWLWAACLIFCSGVLSRTWVARSLSVGGGTVLHSVHWGLCFAVPIRGTFTQTAQNHVVLSGTLVLFELHLDVVGRKA